MLAESHADETLQCCQCSKTFTYTAQEQEIHQQKGYEHKPKRCPECRVKRRNTRNNGGNGTGKPRRKPKFQPSSMGGMSDRDLILEVGKSVTELRIYVEKEFRKLYKFLDEVFPEDDLQEDDLDETT